MTDNYFIPYLTTPQDLEKFMRAELAPSAEVNRRLWELVPYFMNVIMTSGDLATAMQRVNDAYLYDGDRLFFAYFCGEIAMDARWRIFTSQQADKLERNLDEVEKLLIELQKSMEGK